MSKIYYNKNNADLPTNPNQRIVDLPSSQEDDRDDFLTKSTYQSSRERRLRLLCLCRPPATRDRTNLELGRGMGLLNVAVSRDGRNRRGFQREVSKFLPHTFSVQRKSSRMRHGRTPSCGERLLLHQVSAAPGWLARSGGIGRCRWAWLRTALRFTLPQPNLPCGQPIGLILSPHADQLECRPPNAPLNVS
jgi:hypothetical protein